MSSTTTSSGGNTTGDVQYADALEFDFTGEWVMYDALNGENGSGNTTIEYWDIGFLKIWNSEFDLWSLGEVSKLFSSLPADVSIGNPTFSKNSPYIIAFDYFDDTEAAVLGFNLETSEDGLIHAQDGLGYPSFSRLDDAMVYDDYDSGSLSGLAISDLQDNKIEGFNHGNIGTQFRWARWFSNGDRLSNTSDLNDVLNEIKVYPNPSSGNLFIDFEALHKGLVQLEIFNLMGQKVYGQRELLNKGQNSMNLQLPSKLKNGQYLLQVVSQGKKGSMMIQLYR